MNKLISRLSIIVLLAFGNSHTYAQKNAVDSLRKVLQHQQEDTGRVNSLNLLAQQLVTQDDFVEGYTTAVQALKIAEKIDYAIGQGKALQNIGYGLEMQEKYAEARKQYENAIKVFMKAGHKSETADVYSSIVSSYNGEQNDPAALENIYKSLRLYEEADNKEGIAAIYMMLGSKQISNDEYDVGISNLQSSLKVFEKLNEQIPIAVINSMLGSGYYKKGKFIEALQYDSIALRIYDSVHEVFNKGMVFRNRAAVYEAQGDNFFADGEENKGRKKYNDALQEQFLALNVYKETGSKQFEHSSNTAIGGLYIKLHDLEAAKLHLDKSADYLSALDTATRKNFGSWLEDLHLALSKLDSASGDKAKAYSNYKLYMAYRDHNTSEDKARKMQQLKMQYESDKKESFAKAQQAIKDAEATRLRNLQYSVIAIVLLAALFFYWNSTQKQKAKIKIEQAYSELKSTQSQLIQAEKMASLGELTAGIAHEIQNPLNFVNNFSEINNELIEELKTQRSTLKSAEYDELLNDIFQNNEKINHHGKRADAIVKGMLQHSRTSTSTKEPTDINKLTDEYLRLAYHGLRAKDNSFNATLNTSFDDSIGLIYLVPQDIGRVLLNLLNNAFYAIVEKKRQQPGGYEPMVAVTTKKLNQQVEITISDNGNGISQNIVGKIFQPFFTTKPTGQGTGLGLSLSYDIIKAHGGEIKVETKEGEGSTFIIQLATN